MWVLIIHHIPFQFYSHQNRPHIFDSMFTCPLELSWKNDQKSKWGPITRETFSTID